MTHASLSVLCLTKCQHYLNRWTSTGEVAFPRGGEVFFIFVQVQMLGDCRNLEKESSRVTKELVSQNKHTAVLLASGFDEEQVVAILCQMRTAGLPVSLIGLSTKPLTGMHGVALCPDGYLTDLAKNVCFRLIIIPGNGRGTRTLLTSPRFHQLLKNTLAAAGYVAALDTAVPTLQTAGIPSYAAQSDHYLQQDSESLHDFTTHLIELAKNRVHD